MSESDSARTHRTQQSPVLTIVATVADAAAIVALIATSPGAVVSVLATCAIIGGVVVLIQQWGRTLNSMTAASIAVTLVGVTVLSFTFGHKSASAEDPASRAPSTPNIPTLTVTSTVTATVPQTNPQPSLASPKQQTTAGSDGYSESITEQQIIVPYPDLCTEPYSVDLDVPQVGPTDAVDGDVEVYDCGTDGAVFRPNSSSDPSVGTAAANRPEPKNCITIAQTQAINELEVKHFDARTTSFCIVTDKKAVAWLLYTGREGNDLKFDLTLWHQ